VARGDAYDGLAVRPSKPMVERALDLLFGAEKPAGADLTSALERLRGAIDERGRMEQELRREVEARRRGVDLGEPRRTFETLEAALRRAIQER
jgi:hypothetical protein